MRRTDRVRWSYIAHQSLWPGAFLVIAAMAATLVVAPLNTDSGYSLMVARRLLNGDRLYVDMIETNAPMIFWLYELPALADRYLTVRDDRLVGVWVALVLVASCVFAAVILRSASRIGWRLKPVIVVTFAVAVVIPFVAQVGQREQIAALLWFPYTLVAARDIDDDPVRWPLVLLAAIAAAVGMAIKPFFFAPWIGLEAATFAVRRRSRHGFSIVLGLQACYWLVVFVGNPAYLNNVVPLARAWYWAYGTTLTAMLTAKHVWVLALGAAAACAVRLVFPNARGSAEALAFGASSIGWLAAAVWQSKDWYYHLLPALVYTTLALVVSAAGVASAIHESRRRHDARERLALMGIAAATTIAAVWLALATGSLARSISSTFRDPYGAGFNALAEFVGDRAGGEPVYVMSTGMFPTFPLLNFAGATMPYRYHFLWPMPALYGRTGRSRETGRAPKDQSPLERGFFDAVVGDLVEKPPRLLIVNHDPNQQAMNGVAIDFLAYFSQAPQFRSLLQKYQHRGSVAQLEIYELR